MTSEEANSKGKVGEGQLYNMITGGEVSWQSIILDLINTEQLDPWDIDLGVLADRYVKVIQEMEDADFYVSSKVLYACSYLLRIKAERLSNRYLQELDEAIYGKQDDKKYVMERIELDEDEIPILVPKTPMARYKRVTLDELMSALHKAVETENRRIRKDIKVKQAERAALVVLPSADRVPLKDRISLVFEKIHGMMSGKKGEGVTFSRIAPSREEKLASFLPVLHLSNDQKVFLRQPKHFEEVFIHFELLQDEIDEINKELQLYDGVVEEATEEEVAELEEFEEEMKKVQVNKKVEKLDKEMENNTEEL